MYINDKNYKTATIVEIVCLILMFIELLIIFIFKDFIYVERDTAVVFYIATWVGYTAADWYKYGYKDAYNNKQKEDSKDNEE